MFHGSLPQDVLDIIAKEVKKWNEDEKCKRLYIGCSGNFTIERILNGIWDKEIISNDVTIYSCILGAYFSQKEFKLKLKDSYNGNFKFVKDYLSTKEDKVTTLLILSDALKYDDASKSNLEYFTRMLSAYKDQWNSMFTKTKKKLQAMKTRSTDFYAGDVCELIDKVEKNDAFICYPPFYSGDYEKMFEKLSEMFEWDEPKYEMINKEKIHELFRKMTKLNHFMFGVDEDLEEFSKYKFSESQTTNRGRKIYLYSNCNDLVFIQPNQKISEVKIPRLNSQDVISENSTIALKKINSQQFHALRSEYMNVSIKPGQETLAIGVIVDDKLAGCYAFSSSSTLCSDVMSKHMEMPMIYLLSDFPVNSSKYKRLSKLILYAALSKESQMIAQSITKKKIESIGTNAFSKRPVSMKYRGLFELLIANKMSDVADIKSADISENYYNTGYKLYYGSKMGRWTLRQGFEEWYKKHSKDLVKKE